MRATIILIFAILIVGCSTHADKQKSTSNEVLNYTEKYRPQIHFSPDSMWMNDPNGMFYYEGEYHLFYQYYPGDIVWGPMHWGHAISKDLVHWEHLPIALYPDSLGYIFSGSAVVDWKNTSGLGNDGIPPIIAIYTYHDAVKAEQGKIDYQTQGIAFSLDKGRTWTKYQRNPVMENPGIQDFRDPKVRWYEPSQKWIMSLAVKDHISFYSSKDLLTWKHESDFQPQLGAYGGVWECPDLFPLKDEKTGEEKWVLFVSINPGAPNGGSGTQYFVGSFNGKEFKNENQQLYWIDYGTDNYAGVTWSDVSKEDGRTLFLGWMSNWLYGQKVPTERWRSAMTVPRELKLRQEGDDLILVSLPVDELYSLRKDTFSTESVIVEGSTLLFEQVKAPFEFIIEFEDDSNSGDFGFAIKNKAGEELVVAYNPSAAQLSIDRSKSGLTNFSDDFKSIQYCPIKHNEKLNFRVIVDWSSVEIFVNDGERSMTCLAFPQAAYDSVHAFSTNGTVKVNKAEFFELASIW